jgi:hypothetical protein
VWNAWRSVNDELVPDLRGAELVDYDLGRFNLSEVDFGGALLSRTRFYYSDLKSADLSGAALNGATFINTDCVNAKFMSVSLSSARFYGVDLSGADFSGAVVRRTQFRDAIVDGAVMGYTILADLDLRGMQGLESVLHEAPSAISIGSIYLSEGNIPEIFLRGCGVPDSLITQIPALVGAMQPIQFYSCFISYSGKDEEFARRLHSRMRESDLRVWFAPEDMKGGDKIYDQIDRAIQVHDRLLLVLSEDSLQSKWVETEIRRARKVEVKEGRRKLFPIRLTTYEALQEWVCIDSSTGEDLAEEVRGYFIPDFSNWKSHDDFERAFTRLYEDLKASVG